MTDLPPTWAVPLYGYAAINPTRCDGYTASAIS